MFPFRKAKDETDEFTRIREVVRVDPNQPMAAPPMQQQPQQAEGSWMRPMQGGQVMPNQQNPYQQAPGAQPTQVPQPASNGTVLYMDASFDGRLTSEGSIHIQGKVKGEVRAADTVYVAKEARVEATIKAATVIVAGDVTGDITCSGKLEVIPTGRISGEMDAGRLVIHEGAYVNSAFKMAGVEAAGNGSGRPSGSRQTTGASQA